MGRKWETSLSLMRMDMIKKGRAGKNGRVCVEVQPAEGKGCTAMAYVSVAIRSGTILR